jgi:hypothetical protein
MSRCVQTFDWYCSSLKHQHWMKWLVIEHILTNRFTLKSFWKTTFWGFDATPRAKASLIGCLTLCSRFWAVLAIFKPAVEDILFCNMTVFVMSQKIQISKNRFEGMYTTLNNMFYQNVIKKTIPTFWVIRKQCKKITAFQHTNFTQRCCTNRSVSRNSVHQICLEGQ